MKYLIPIIVGAIIGYITNWFAIKMLFRPHYEKRFLGVHVPFTPGLIPKEKARIARSVGETVGSYLLSPEIIMDSISNGENNHKIKRWLEYKINNLKESDKTLKDFTKNLSEEQFGDFFSTIEKSITDFIYSEIKDQSSKNETIEAVSKQKVLGEIVPDSIIVSIKEYIEGNDENIVNGLREIFETPYIKTRLKESITEAVSQNVSRLITRFVSVELITEKIFNAIENYIHNPNINKNIAIIMTTSIDKLLEKEISTETLYDYISLFTKKTMDKIINKPISEIIGDMDEASVTSIADISKDIFEDFTKNQLPYLVELFNISKVVEDEINKFDVAFAEEIILEIASKELKAITWLGALLGGIMGILSPILSVISAT